MQFIRGQGLDAVLHEVKRLRRDPSPSKATEAPDDQVSSIMLARGLRTGRFLTNQAESEKTGSPAAGAPPTNHGRAPALAATTSLSPPTSDQSELSDQPEAQ
jgi:hypothetical protein